MHIVIAIVVALIVGGAVAYGFRGKVHKEIKAAGSAASSEVNSVAKKL